MAFRKRGPTHESFTGAGRAETLRLLAAKLDEEVAIGIEREDEPPDAPRRIAEYVANRGGGFAEFGLLSPAHPYKPDDRVTLARIRIEALAFVIALLKVTEPLGDNDEESEVESWVDLIKQVGPTRRKLERMVAGARKVVANSWFDVPLREPTRRLPTLVAAWDRTIVTLDELERDLGSAIRKASLDDYNRARRVGGRGSSYFLGRIVHALRKVRGDGPRPFTLEEVLDLVVDETTVEATDDRKQRYRRAERAYKAFEKELSRSFSSDAEEP
jgi:hypothetical protein